MTARTAEQGPRASRSRRRRAVRSHSVSVKRLTLTELAVGRALFPAEELRRLPMLPTSRDECVSGPRPCPFVSCRHHLYLDVQAATGSIKFNFPDLEPGELADSCALDVAARGGATLERVAELMNMTRERVRQIERSVGARVQRDPELAELLAHEAEPWATPAPRTVHVDERDALEALGTDL